MKLIDKLKTIYDIAKETKRQLTTTKQSALDSYQETKAAQKELNKQSRRSLKQLRAFTKQPTLTRQTIHEILHNIDCQIEPLHSQLTASYKNLTTTYQNYQENGGHNLEEIDELLNQKANVTRYNQLLETMQLVRSILQAK